MGAPQGIEIAPASDFGRFRLPNPSPASIFSKIPRGPSHDTLELLNPEGFSFKALVREPEVREQRKSMNDASAFRRAISPVRVLLFGVTTLRVT